MKIKDLVLQPLPYSFTDLDPVISSKIMELHYTKHHQGYLTKLLTILDSNPDLGEMGLEEAFSKIDTLPKNIQQVVKNMGGGFWNHTFFWQVMCKPNTSNISNSLDSKIKDSFGSFEKFVEEFVTKATTLFGSGWVWLVKSQNGLELVQTQNQENPLMGFTKNKFKPILAIDVWEHAYYLDYLNDRGAYVNNFFKIINWQKVEENLNS